MMDVCHVYAQPGEHASARIVGSRDALESIAMAIQEALNTGYAAAIELMAADGEGFQLDVECDEADWQSQEWQARPKPYAIARQ